MRNTFPKRPSARWTFISSTYLPQDVSLGAVIDTRGFIWTHPDSLVATDHNAAQTMAGKIIESTMNIGFDDEVQVVTFCIGPHCPAESRHVRNLIRHLPRIHDPVEIKVALVAYGVLSDRYQGSPLTMEELKTDLVSLMEDTPSLYVQT